jgi:hypothetical protein
MAVFTVGKARQRTTVKWGFMDRATLRNKEKGE